MKRISLLVLLVLLFSLFSCSNKESDAEATRSGGESTPAQTADSALETADQTILYSGESTPAQTADNAPETTEKTISTAFDDSASANGKTVVSEEDYAVLLYENSLGGEPYSFAPEYRGTRFEMEFYQKDDQPRRTETVFGKTKSLQYWGTFKTDELSYEVDLYGETSGGDFMSVSRRTDNGEIVKYDALFPPPLTGESPIGKDSSDADRIAYAKAILLDVAKTSTAGWDARIERRALQILEDGNLRDVDGYTVTFFKTIGGIERFDRMQVKMTDDGYVLYFNALNYEEAFAPFEQAQLDKDKLAHSFPIKSCSLIPKEGSLWVQAADDSGRLYVVKVAHLE